MQSQRIEAWRSREVKLARARYDGMTGLSRWSKKLRRHIETPVEDLQRRNNRFFDTLHRGGSFGATARTLV